MSSIKEVLNEKEIEVVIKEVLETMNEENFLTETFFQIFQRILSGFTDEHIQQILINEKNVDQKIKIFNQHFEVWREHTANQLVEMVELGVREVGGNKEDALIAADFYLFDKDYYLNSFFVTFAELCMLSDSVNDIYDMEAQC